MTLNVLSVASEAAPLIKTGGLADVAGALPGAVAPHGVSMTSFIPAYPSVLKAVGRTREVHRWDSLLGEPARLLSAKISGRPLLVLDAPAYFQREGGPYGDPFGNDWSDNWHRFAALSRAAADIAGGAVKGRSFDLLHAHDWQAGLAPAYLRFAPFGGRRVPSVMTIHNMAFQGFFPASVFKRLELPKAAWAIDGVESYGGVGLLKAGLQLADLVTTVSPTYAAEIRMPEYGMGLEGLIVARGDDVVGILNGIDSSEWDPGTDRALAVNYSAKSIASRTGNKRALEREFGLERDDGPVFIVVSRLTWQKGMDVLPEVLDHLVGNGARLTLLGSGDAGIEQALRDGAARHPGRIGVRFGYDEQLSHRMQGGGDAILIPSRFEPCGLTQMYGLAYGCVPVVARTGGLADTVIDANVAALSQNVATGVQFTGVDYHALATAISRTVALYRDRRTWRSIQRNGMSSDFSWTRSGRAYADHYRRLVAEAA